MNVATKVEQATPLVEMQEAPANLPAIATQAIDPAPAPMLPPVIMAPCGKIATAIASVMGEIGVVAKEGRNTFHGYDYVKMEDLLQRATPLLAKHGLVIFQNEVDRGFMDDGKAVHVKYAFTLVHSSGEVWPERLYQTGLASCRHKNGGFDDKSLNKCHTAARKYFLLALLQIPTGDEQDDADSGEAAERHSKPKAEPKHSRQERANVNWSEKLSDFKAIVNRYTSRGAILEWCNLKKPEISGFPEAMQDDLRDHINACLKRVDAATVADRVVHDEDGERPATPEDFEEAKLEPETITKPTGPAPAAPHNPDGIAQRAIDAREGRPPKLKEVDPLDVPKELDRRPNPEKWLAGLELAAEAARDLESLNKAQVKLMPQSIKNAFDQTTWEKAIYIFRERAVQLTEGADDPFDVTEWLRNFEGALSGCEDVGEMRKIKEILLEGKGKAPDDIWDGEAAKYRSKLAALTQSDLLRV